ncbi:hypothetical protein BX666DRAFT_1996463 [Dichotomocladium elegans]|nr:hypothetical protein BX666DRAFT_1996463 [Dichotomocladium elegans]
MTEIGSIKATYSCQWRIPNWSKLETQVDHCSPPVYLDGHKWLIKLLKGRLENDDGRDRSRGTLSLFLELQDTGPGSLKGIRKRVAVTFKVNNTNPSNYNTYDFGVARKLDPVWFTEKKKRWGVEKLANLASLSPFLNQDHVSVSVIISITKSEVDPGMAVIGPRVSPFASYFNSPELSDIQFIVRDITPAGEDRRLFYGHKMVLSSMSSYFKCMFTSGLRETYEEKITIEGIRPDIFERILRYCYTFDADIPSITVAEQLLKAADRLELGSLREEAFRFLRQELTEFNVWRIWDLADTYDCPLTLNACERFVSHALYLLLKTPQWLHAKPNVVKMTLAISEGFLPKEEELYEDVIAWAKYIPDRHPRYDPTAAETEPDQHLNPTAASDRRVVGSICINDDCDTILDDNSASKRDMVTMVKSERVPHEGHTEMTDNKANSEPPLLLSDEEKMMASERRAELVDILQYIRFPLMDAKFIANVVEKDPFVMELDGIRDLLYEAYRYHAIGLQNGEQSFRCEPRRMKT